MRKLLSQFVIALVAVTSLTACGGGSSTAEESFIEGSGAITKIAIKDRKAAPALSGLTLTGKTFIFNPGQVAVVNVWASWCSPCKHEEPLFCKIKLALPKYVLHVESDGENWSAHGLTIDSVPSYVLKQKDDFQFIGNDIQTCVMLCKIAHC